MLSLRQEYYRIINRIDEKMTLQDQMLSLRRLVLQKGLPDESLDEKIIGDTSLIKCSLRGIVWKLLLGALHVDAMHYISLVQVLLIHSLCITANIDMHQKEGPCSADQKIRDDTFRTFKGDSIFWDRVTESEMTRVLSGFARFYFQREHYYVLIFISVSDSITIEYPSENCASIEISEGRC